MDLRGYVYNKSEPAHKHKKKCIKQKEKKKQAACALKCQTIVRFIKYWSK